MTFAPIDPADLACLSGALFLLAAAIAVAAENRSRRLEERAESMRRNLHTGPDAIFPEDRATVHSRRPDAK